jgi:hypothetical protein
VIENGFDAFGEGVAFFRLREIALIFPAKE